MSKLHEISYSLEGEYIFDGTTFEYDCKVWMTRDYEICDVIFNSILVFNSNGDCIEDYQITSSEIDNIMACASQKALEKVQAADFEIEGENV